MELLNPSRLENNMGIREQLEDFVWEAQIAQRRMTPTTHQQQVIDTTVPVLVAQMRDMDSTDMPTHKGVRLLPLGETSWPTRIGNVSCTQALFLGENGKFYVEGPRKRLGKTVIDTHPYDLTDAMEGVSIGQLSDALITYVI